MPTITWDKHLTNQQLGDVRDAMVAAGINTDAQLDSLLVGIDLQYAGSLPTAGLPPNAKLQVVLNSMNSVSNLRDGDVPLAQYLERAAFLAAGKPQAEVIEAAVENVKGDLTMPPGPTQPPDLAAANIEVEPEALIAGEENTISIKYLSLALEATRSVCKVLVHRHVGGEPEFSTSGEPRLSNGTAWFIGPRLIITNHHVINARRKWPVDEGDASASDFKLQAENTEIHFDYFDQNAPPSATVKSGPDALVASDKDLDFAILRLPGGAPDRPPFTIRSHSIRKTLDQALGARVNLLQHPNGKPMRLGFRDNFVVLGNDQILSYLTDTDHGSSGSPVCDDTWKVAALHSGSRNISAQHIVIRGKEVKRENYGIPLRTILIRLRDTHPELHTEIAGVHP